MLMKNIVNRALVAKKKQFQSKSVPRGTRTIWRYLGALFLLFTFAVGNVWAANVPAAAGTYSVVGKKPGNANRFYKLGNGVYIHRINNSSWDSSMGMKIPSDNQNGVAVYLSSSMKVSALINKKSDKNAVNVELKAYPITNGPTTFDAFEAGSDNSTDITVTRSSTASYTLSTSFAKLDSKAAENKSTNEVSFAAGYYYIVGTDDAGTTYLTSITLTAASSDPVDPTITFNNGAYTIGGSALNLSSLFASNSAGAVTYSVKNDGGTSASIDGTNFTATAAGTCVVTASQAAETGKYKAKDVDANIVVSPAETPACPAGLSISGTKDYTAGQTISLEAAIEAGNGEIAYNWYKGDDLATAKAAGSIGTGTSFSKASCATSDAGNYFCVATKATCSDAESAAYAVTVAAPSYCAELYPATTGSSPSAANQEIILQTESPNASYGGKIYTHSKKSTNSWEETFTYTSKGLQLNKSGDDKVRVELNHLLAENTVITVNMDWTRSDDKSSGVILRTGDDSQSVKTMTKKNPSGDFSDSYTIQSTDTKLIGSNSFILARSNSIGIKSITVSNCGAELHELSSAIDPVHDPAYATITLSKSLVAAGGTATATYSAIDAAYDFDEWVISGATIDNPKANPVTITMGSTDATITLKLKAAEVKHTVTYYDGETELGTELVVEGENPTATGIAAPKKIGYTFAGWSTTNGGDATALSGISVAADMPLYAVYNAINCSALSGTIFYLILNNAPAANCTIKNASGFDQEADLIKYGTVSGGIALAKNSSSNNHIVITTDPKLRLLGGSGKVHIQFDCALKEGDKIRTTIENQNIAYTTSDSRSTTNYFEKGTAKELTITKDHVLENASEIYLWSASSSDGKLISLEVIRPEKLAVTFNMHGHGDQVAQQDILEGGKVTEPATTDITGWDFGGWFKTYVAEPESYSDAWDFENDVVSAATELHAKWTAHVASNDVALGTLSVNGEAITIVPSQTVYAVELPFGTTAVPAVTATANDENVKAFTITQATAVDGSATIYVKAEDNSTEATYTINFSVATSKDIQLVFKTGTIPCVGSASTAAQILSNNAAVSTYIKQITFTNVEGAGDDGAEGGSLNVGKKAGNMFTLSAKPGYAFQAMNFLAKIQDATCEYSINGGAWTELASTNTGGDECYAPFSAAEVHEFRLRSTGASGVWIRNMQLTVIEACTPIVVAWDEEPVEFEVGKSGYAIAATANNGGTVSYSTTASEVVDVVAATGALTISGLGSATLKAATAEGDGTSYCANGGNNIEISKAVNTYYLVKFEAQNGDAADEVKYYSGDEAIALPDAPSYSGYDFQGWFDAETGGNKYTAAITPTASTTVYAQWVAQCAGATITTQPTGASYLTGRTAADLVCEATAGNGGALTYEWFTCDDEYKANPVAATATPSTAVAGTFYYFCKVTEAGCAVEAFSDVVTITVADKDAICIIKSTPTSATEATVDGIYQGSAYFKGNASNKKLSTKYDYVAVELADGYTFQAGDKVVLNQAADLGDASDITKFYVFTEVPADGKSYVTVDNATPVKGDNWFAMPAELVGQSSLYIGRVDASCNPTVGYLAVYRACAPILNKVTVNGAEGKPNALKEVVFEVAASTTQAQLEVIAFDWISNNDAWTADPANAPVAANAWEFGVANEVTFTDKDGDQSVYTITVNKAAASSDATLSALTVNGQAIALEDGVYAYNFELPYGTSVAPTVVATANHIAAVATVDPCTLNGATITVVPESGEADKQVYTLTFTVSAWKEVVIWDGSNMSAVKAVEAADIASWAVNGFGSISNYAVSYEGKDYTKCLPSGGSASATRNIALTVPAGYVAKFYVVGGSHSDSEERTAFIATTATKTYTDEGILTLVSPKRVDLAGGMSEIVGTGTYYINMTASYDFYEIRAYVRKGYVREAMLGAGVYGTICVDHNVAIEDIQGATMYELMGRENTYGKLAFDEIVTGELEAGAPYVFQAHGDKLILFYGETSVADPVDKHNGMYGTFEKIVLTELEGIYYFAQKALWSCDGALDLTIGANRAYVKLGEIDYLTPNQQNPAPGRRRVTMAVNGEKIATGIEDVQGDKVQCTKMLINGQLFILRGEKMYDAKGQLVK